MVRAQVWFLSLSFLTLLAGGTAIARAQPVSAADRGAMDPRAESIHSVSLDGELRFLVALPPEYAREPERRFPVVYLLHGRGDDLGAWTTALGELTRLSAEGRIPPCIAVLPDAPSARRAGYYINSRFAGDGTDRSKGAAVESALTQDLIAHIDGSYRTVAARESRVIAGYSMGGYGALRYALAHPQLFGAALVLSPAVYVPLPPAESSAREFGAFGAGEERFVEQIYRENNYPALLGHFEAAGLPLRMFVAVGDDEHAHTDPEEWRHDLDLEAHAVYNRLRRVPGIAIEFRVSNGPHDWATWRPAFAEGLEFIWAGEAAKR